MTILIIDKIPVYRNGMFFLLSHLFPDHTIFESESIMTFERSFPDKKLDLIAVAIGQISETNDINDIRRARVLYPAAYIVAFGGRLEYDRVTTYLGAGIAGYVSREDQLQEFVQCIEVILTGKKYISTENLLNLLKSGRLNNGSQRSADVPLTENEHKIAQYLCEGRKISWIATNTSRKQSTISTTKANIFTKLNVSDIIQLRDKMQIAGSIFETSRIKTTTSH